MLPTALTGVLYNVGMVAGPLFEGLLVQCLYDIMQGTRCPAAMLKLVLLYLLIMGFVQAMRYAKRLYIRRFANNTSRNMRRVLYNNLLRMDTKQSQEDIGSVMTNAGADIDACVEGVRKFITEVFDTGVVMVAYLVMMLLYDWRLALLSCLFAPPAYYIADRLKVPVTSFNAAYKQSAGRLNSATLDRTGYALTYRVGGVEVAQDARYEDFLNDYERRAVKANFWESTLTPLYNSIIMLGIVPVIFFGARNVLGTGWQAWDIAAFTTFLSCFTKMAAKSAKAAKLFNSVQKAKVSWVRIKPLMGECESVEHLAPLPVRSLGLKAVEVLNGEGESLLRDIDLQAEAGDIIAVTGAIASGKSSLGRVFIRENAYRGLVLIDGRELNSFSEEELMRRVSYMGHDAELISDSIANNIRLGQDIAIEPVLKGVSLYDEMLAMPERDQTLIGNGGIKLSGGQRARLALARTISHGGGILVLDDPFAALDKQTEQEVFEYLRREGREHIILLLSHRLYLFPYAKQVVYLHDGRAEIGTHSELMTSSEGYAALYRSQQGGES